MTDILNVQITDKIWKGIKDTINEQAKEGDSLRGLAKEIFESGLVTEEMVQDIKEVYSTSIEFL